MAFDRPAFGRKGQGGSSFPPHPGPDADGVSRIIPKEAWDGPSGEFLRAIGSDPDDAANMLPTRDLVQARHDAAFAAQTRFVEGVNAQLPPRAQVIPYAMLPWKLWHGEFAPFLMVACEYYPAQPWNTLLLPETEAGAMILDLPVHPAAYPPQLLPAAERHLARFRDELEAAREETGAMLDDANLAGLELFGTALEKAKKEVMATAHVFAETTFGEAAYRRHLAMFGKMLGWHHA